MQERIRSQKSEHSTSENDAVEGVVTASAASQQLKDDLDDLLDEIDEVLDTNAEEFVKNYVQKGGE